MRLLSIFLQIKSVETRGDLPGLGLFPGGASLGRRIPTQVLVLAGEPSKAELLKKFP